VDVPVQYYQSVIAVELAIAGALLFQIRFFAPRGTTASEVERLPDPRVRLFFAVVIGATVFGSLEAILHERQKSPAIAITIGLAVSLLPILLRTLPPLGKHPNTDERDPGAGTTIIGLILYVVVTAGVVILMIT
jgi:hypothetical protein